jgi:hypothetical protein
LPKGTTSKGKGANRNFSKRLRYGKGIWELLESTTYQESWGGGGWRKVNWNVGLYSVMYK